MTETAPVLYGKYQLLELLARGGMAEVFKAKAHGVEGFEKILVIKRILPELSQNPRFVEMFINEAKIAVTLSHANIVQVFDLGRVAESYFIAMEYVAGMDLATVLRTAQLSGNHVPPELAVYMVSELAKGLDYAHRRRDPDLRPLNIVHRDVSPQNILLSFEGEVKLTDFGIAKARTLAQQATEFGVIKGKYAYLAPEQLEGGKITARTDIFATGTVLYEALSGTNPFRAGSSYDTLQRIRSGDVAPIQSLVPQLPDEVARLVNRAMAQRPDDRHENAGQLYEELLQFLYSSQRRVGARELADYLLELRAHQDVTAAEGDDHQFREAFESDSVHGEDADGGDTRVGLRARPSRTPSRTPSATRAKAERRDVTAVALVTAAVDPLPAPTVARLVRRFGGSLLEPPEDIAPNDGTRSWFVLFGERVPDGRDTETAARLALRVVRAAGAEATDAGVQTSVRIGVCAGRILVDLSGDLLKDNHYRSVLEQALHLAQRTVAGHVLANADAEKSLRGRFRLVLSHQQQPRTFVLTSERSLAEAYGRFVGRREELRKVGEVLAMANRGDLRILGIRGEPGAGKSRLLLETLRRLRLAGHKVAMYVATCTPQMQEVPFAALQETLRVVLGIDEFDPEPLMRERTARLRELGLTPIEQAAIAAALGIQTPQREPTASDRPLKAALIRILRRLAEDGLTVFAMDGSEYMDLESRELIGGLLRTVRKARLALVLTFRPGHAQHWANFPSYTELEVPPLDEDDVAKLMASRLTVDEIPLELLREVATKSGGNPLYVEEYLKALLEAGALAFEQEQIRYRPEVAHVEVPKTLRGIVAARIARLGPVPRYILQVAAIAGQRFPTEIVAAAAEEDVAVVTRALASRPMEGIVTRQGPTDYTFSHDLVRQVLLESLTLEARKEIHAAVAHALEELYPEQKAELAERLARHQREAGMHERAVDYLLKVADRHEADHAFQNAIATLVKAVDWLRSVATPDSSRVLDIHLRLGQLAYRARDLLPGVERMRAALKLAEATGDAYYIARCSLLLGRLLVSASKTEEGRRCLDQARHMARQLGDSGLSRDILVVTAEADARSGLYDKAVRCLQDAFALAEQHEDRSAQIQCLMPLALTYARMGDHASALTTLERARTFAGHAADVVTRCDLYKLESQIHYHARDPQALIRAASQALELAKEAGLIYEAALNGHNLGDAYLRLGDHKRAFGSLRYSYEVAVEHGLTKLQMANMRILGFIDGLRFGSEEGSARLAQAIEYAEANGYVWDLIQGLYLLALIQQNRGDLPQAAQNLRQVLKLAAEHGHRKYVEDSELALRQLAAGEPITLQK